MVFFLAGRGGSWGQEAGGGAPQASLLRGNLARHKTGGGTAKKVFFWVKMLTFAA